ncbi:YgiW/YdeI family stress tolerance OB fold protein [Mesorhizobium xinjiangense]|uniref:YgiW/YdeI family stress tolerance OB fold protein n=1 Tax=Mesorhizobium xinjiangense TaxID=2678685 RepID=UPI0012EE37EA|nr:NirD/YgiW/YdeI family stress tolerance protein [Mesorhizobium xinjiangense]
MKSTLVAAIVSAFLVTSASAQFIGPSHYEDITTVEQAQAARRGQAVTLDGFVVEHLRGRYYLFRDATGEMRVKIGRLVWRDHRVTSRTPIRLTGQIDRDFREIYIDVDRVEVLG